MKVKNIILVMTVLVIGLVLSFVLKGNDVVIDSDEGQIHGSLRDVGKDKLVIIIAGSGPTDRDGNSDLMGGKNNSLLELALGLNKEGISTFNYDKRSSGASIDTFDMEEVVFQDFVSDGQAVLEAMIEKGFNEIYLLGHSQGALVAEIVGQDPRVKGIVSLSGTIRSIDQVLVEQFQQADAKTAEAAIAIIEDLKKSLDDRDLKDSNPDVIEIPESLEAFFGGNMDFLKSYIEENPLDYIKPVSDKILFIYGDMDSQVTSQEALMAQDELGSAVPVHLIENMNHVLKFVENTQEDAESYSQPIYPIHEELVDLIAGFVLQ